MKNTVKVVLIHKQSDWRLWYIVPKPVSNKSGLVSPIFLSHNYRDYILLTSLVIEQSDGDAQRQEQLKTSETGEWN